MRLLVACTLLALAAAPVHADEDDTQKARSHFEKGMGHFQLEEYDAAIENWEAGFRLKPVPEFLYNIAQAYRASKRTEKAIQFYKKYLRLAPEARNRGEVERHLAALQQRADEQASNPPPARTIEPPPLTAAPAARESAPTEVTSTVPPRKPITRKAWFWAVLGGGAALVVAAVAVGVVLSAPSNGAPPNTLAALRF